MSLIHGATHLEFPRGRFPINMSFKSFRPDVHCELLTGLKQECFIFILVACCYSVNLLTVMMLRLRSILYVFLSSKGHLYAFMQL